MGGSALGNFLCSGSQGESGACNRCWGRRQGVIRAQPLYRLPSGFRFIVQPLVPRDVVIPWTILPSGMCVLLDYKNQILACPCLVTQAEALTGEHLGHAF